MILEPSLSFVPIDPVGQQRSALVAAITSWSVFGCWKTDEYSPASSNVAGASCLHVSQFIQVVSTKKLPGALVDTIFRGSAMVAAKISRSPWTASICRNKRKFACMPIPSSRRKQWGPDTSARRGNVCARSDRARDARTESSSL